MTNAIQLFQFEQSNVRALEIENEPWFVGKDVAEILGYSNTNKALKDHIDEEDKRGYRIVTPSGKQTAKVINESGLYSLILSSKMPNAKKFKHWVTSKVLPQIRRTGSYIPDEKKKRLSIMEENSKVKKATLLYKIAMASDESDLKQNLLAKAATTITGEMTLPVMQEKYYTANEVGESLNITGWRVGHVAKALGLKAEQPGQNEYGKWVNSKSASSDKEVPQWLYTNKAIERIKRDNFLVK
ncbi:Bro-N domain-containing protein [Lactobacillus sp. HT06-2]|uniref:BRO-N domain-containing protein n=1 Tax=Lactobacillus sp. HT06-2 TaxID=2080222 RepID=UPI000CD7FE01|nr:Bro-N domain-containing protein [Lactobacillus sp. HT06-2]